MRLDGYICDLCGSTVFLSRCDLLFVGTSEIGAMELCEKCYGRLNNMIQKEIKDMKKEIKWENKSWRLKMK